MSIKLGEKDRKWCGAVCAVYPNSHLDFLLFDLMPSELNACEVALTHARSLSRRKKKEYSS